MFGLIPTEHYEYNLSDIFRGVIAALSLRGKRDLLNIPGLGNCIPTRSARASIVAAIKALDLPPGARIGVPLYCCPVVFKAIKETGCVARFIDVEYSTYCMSADDLSAKRAKLNAVIAVHMFGNLCDMPSMLDAAQGIPIIEDCAQSLGSRCDGRLAGSYGAVAAFSFRSGKYLAVGEGGALFTCDAEINRRLIALIEAMQTPSFLEECKHVAETYLRSLLRNRPLYGLIGYRIWSMYNKITDYTEKSPIVLSQSFKSDLAITLKRLPYLDSAIQRQRANADFYSRNLNLEPIMLCRERNGAFYNRFMYPITFPSETQRDAMAAYLFNRGIGAIHPYKDIAEVAANHYGYDGSCPVAEQIAKRVLVLPSNYSLNTHTVEYISHCVNEGWKNLSSYKN